MIKHYRSVSPEITAVDTETTGLHIIGDRPFLFPFGYYDSNYYGYAYLVRREWIPLVSKSIFELTRKNILVGHNLTFDLHMLANVGSWYQGKCCDTTACIRLAHDALTQKNGGPPLGLKEYASRYIDRNAKLHEQKLNAEKTSIAKEANLKLKNRLRSVDKTWTLKKLNDTLSDYLSDLSTLSEDEQHAYKVWLEEDIHPRIRETMTGVLVSSNEIPYDILNRENLETYAYYDIVYTCEIYLQTMPAIAARKQEPGLQLECDLILPLFRMERVGFEMQKEYVLKAQQELADYIRDRRARLKEIVGYDISPNQSAVIAEILRHWYYLDMASTSKEVLDKFMEDNPEHEAIEFISIIQELRTLSKWYQTYLMRFIREAKKYDRVYTTIFSVGTVTGRVTSDFQQFPKYGISRYDGTPLFDPRNMVCVSEPEGYRYIAYIDYSQIELRLQAMYTILVGEPDLNLCRAYMPYQCKDETGHLFDYMSQTDLRRAYSETWYRAEDNEVWVPVDVHTATTSVAFPDVPVGSAEFKKLRAVGKRVNFAKNYGAQYDKIKSLFPEFDEETIVRINESYYKAFPGVKKYHEYCYNLAKAQGFGTNLFGGRYYGVSGHKLINMLVQGSGAYLLKQKIIELDSYIQHNKLRSRMQMNIHDEISFEIYPSEEEHIREFKRIMEDVEDTLVPIVADVEVTETTWAKKVDYE